MGIQIEFNPDLALREFGTDGRLKEECLPKNLISGVMYSFLKEGQRAYWLEGDIPLKETRGNQQLSRPLASIRIINSTHFIESRTREPYTRGKYIINEIFDPRDPTIHFESYDKLKC